MLSVELQPSDGELDTLYQRYVGDYPKFYKMDLLCKVGFIASELLLLKEGVERFIPRTDRAIILTNKSASITNDRAYLQTQQDHFPSPALFVYTLPNIVTGEIAIRNHYFGETSFYVLQREEQLEQLAPLVFQQQGTTSAIVGWIECPSKDEYYCKMQLLCE